MQNMVARLVKDSKRSYYLLLPTCLCWSGNLS